MKTSKSPTTVVRGGDATAAGLSPGEAQQPQSQRREYLVLKVGKVIELYIDILFVLFSCDLQIHFWFPFYLTCT